MTDLPADPSAWDHEPDAAPGRARDAGGRSSGSATADPPLPVRIVGEGASADDDGLAPVASPAVSYQPLTSLAPRSSKALIGPFVGVALLALGLGFLLARTAGSGGASTSRTIVTPPPNTAAVLGGSAKPSSTVAATTVASAPSGAASTAASAPATTAAAAASAASTAPAPTAASAAPTTVAASAAAPTTAAAAQVSGVDVATPVRYAEFRAGKVYLHGRVPNAAVAATIVRKVAAVVGEANVIQDYTVDPTTPAVAGGPLKVAETVQFEMDSSVLRPEFGRILELGVLLMNQNPAVRITVVGRSDSRGPVRYNQELSQRRADAVVAYFVSRGIDRDRLTIDARGADDPLAAGDSAEDLQANRSVEFVILGLLE